jgi:hypothetical protein
MSESEIRSADDQEWMMVEDEDAEEEYEKILDESDSEDEDEEEEEEDFTNFSREWWLHFLGLDDEEDENAFDPEEIDQLMKDIEQMMNSTHLMTKCIDFYI